ncbi:MAG: hypothetical protein PHS80_08490 [Methanothrix sp.]|nr:hypothetical protein [Methanothrix sp.]MDD4448008.1 hypothetical protein [Methanothrix sp.]
MAGDAIPYPQDQIFRLQNQEPQDLFIDWSSSFAVDLKHENEIKELRSIVTKLTEEVNRLERIIINVGVIVPISQIGQVSRIIDLEGTIGMKIDDELAKLDLNIPNQSSVRDYLVHHLDMVDLLPIVSEKIHQKFSIDSVFSLEIASDADDQYITINVRQTTYDDSVMDRIREIRKEYSPLLVNKSGWFLLTTDYISQE